MSNAVDRFITINDLSLHYLEWGKATNPPLILLHGGSAHAHWWDHIAPALAQTYWVLAFDLRGHGDSDWTSPPMYEIADYVSDLKSLVTDLKLKIPVLIGHSLGGFVALSYAIQQANLRALVVVDIGPQLRQSRYMRLLRSLSAPVYADEADLYERFRLLPAEPNVTPDLIRHIARQSVRSRNGQLQLKSDRAAMTRQPCDLTPQLPQLTCPTLFIRGQQSSTLSAERLAQTVQACRYATGIEIPQAGHHVFLDQPEAFLDTVNNFLHETDTDKKDS